MRGKRLSTGLRVALVIFSVTLFTSAATHEKVLYNFNGTDGSYPDGGLILDAAGNLYGTTSYGGNYSCNGGYCGTVFELTPAGDGEWSKKVVHYFNGPDGYAPIAGLMFDSVGNLYGTTLRGGDLSRCGGKGCGTVFELTRSPHAVGGGWILRVLYEFQGSDGAEPRANLIRDSAGNLYGTTSMGGTYGPDCADGCGTVFELTPTGGGAWTQTVLHNFNGTDGYSPMAGLIFDAAGNLYGTTAGITTRRCGAVFELTPTGSGGWTETVLHSFVDADGCQPMAGLIYDAAGNLYGTTSQGGTFGCGTVFELTATGGGGWTVTVLHHFNGTDGISSFAGLIFDAIGSLYGTAGGGTYGYGTVFELTRSPHAVGGGWTEQVLHNFNRTDGTFLSGLVMDGAGNFYGTAEQGGTSTFCSFGCGTVFEIVR